MPLTCGPLSSTYGLLCDNCIDLFMTCAVDCLSLQLLFFTQKSVLGVCLQVRAFDPCEVASCQHFPEDAFHL